MAKAKSRRRSAQIVAKNFSVILRGFLKAKMACCSIIVKIASSVTIASMILILLKKQNRVNGFNHTRQIVSDELTETKLISLSPTLYRTRVREEMFILDWTKGFQSRSMIGWGWTISDVIWYRICFITEHNVACEWAKKSSPAFILITIKVILVLCRAWTFCSRKFSLPVF